MRVGRQNALGHEVVAMLKHPSKPLRDGLAADRSRSQRRRSESAEHADAQRAAERTRSRRRRNAETSAQTAARLAAELGRLQRRRQVLKSFEEALIDIDSPTDITRLCETFTLHSCGTITEKCQRCQAVFFSTERLSNSSCNSPKFSLCCGDGKVGLWSVPQPPEPLANLLTGNATHCRKFRRDIRKYNCAPITLIILFLVSHFNFLFSLCGRLSWLSVSFLLHVKYTLSYRIVS